MVNVNLLIRGKMSFPPSPAYPNNIDSDYTLFLVHNTTESQLCSNNAPWSDEIDIVPVAEDVLEIWAENGFGNIEGELFYYDSVEKNSFGKINKLKNCARQLTGKTKFNFKGTWVRGFVVAEHHNQIVDTILNVENFVGYNFDPRHETLDWRIRNLRELNTIFDDYSCPDIEFTFNIVENNPETGILANYVLQITPPGTVNGFRLDFGDGESTTTQLSGTHRYALNAVIDPVVTASNDKCQIIQTPIERTNPSEPTIVDVPIFDIQIPEVPEIPIFTFVPCEVPEPEVNLPPIVFPCVSLEGQIGPLPSVIIGPEINLVSQVVIEGPTEPVQILYSTVTITGGFDLPSYIFVDIPPTIVIDPPIPPTIIVVAQSSITMGFDLANLPKIEVDWGAPPAMEVALTMAKSVRIQSMTNLDNEFGDEFSDIFSGPEQMRVEYEQVGIPSEIKLVAPEKPIMIDATGIPRKIKIDATEVKLPEAIRLILDQPLPNKITIEGPVKPLPDQIELINKNIPTTIEAVNVNIPKKIDVELSKDIPSKIVVEMPDKIPDRIVLDASGVPKSITVNGMIDTITVIGFPDGIQLLPPKQEDMPRVEMFYSGGPLEFKVKMSDMIPTTEDGERQCFFMTPCTK